MIYDRKERKRFGAGAVCATPVCATILNTCTSLPGLLVLQSFHGDPLPAQLKDVLHHSCMFGWLHLSPMLVACCDC